MGQWTYGDHHVGALSSGGGGVKGRGSTASTMTPLRPPKALSSLGQASPSQTDPQAWSGLPFPLFKSTPRIPHLVLRSASACRPHADVRVPQGPMLAAHEEFPR